MKKTKVSIAKLRKHQKPLTSRITNWLFKSKGGRIPQNAIMAMRSVHDNTMYQAMGV